ncbi:MAG: alpha-hydroxy-acid oxidizing protein [Bryobacterales bacterium]|nr:alpha-hydroxy-acid oxidizing protein [Bryobacterales bacterium]
MRISRRAAMRAFLGWTAASPLSIGQDYSDPLYGPINIFDFADLAKKKLDPMAWDYLDGGSEDEQSLRDSRDIFKQVIIRPRMLVDTHKIDLTTDLYGQKLDYPIIIDPSGGKNCFHPKGEEAVALAANNAKALHITNGGIDDIIESGKGAKVWWQLTTGGQLQNQQTMRSFVKRIEAQGCSGICFTVDIMHVSHRERDMHNKLERSWCESGLPKRDAQGRMPEAKNPWRAGLYPSRLTPTPTWNSLRELRQLTKLPIVVKGILIGEDAARCVDFGASGIIVSSHGARQMDHVGSTLEALPECVRAVNGRIPVMIDGGFRRGTDILKALALGAKAVAIARPYLYGLACFGQRGVERVLELLKTELALSMALSGVPNIASIDRSLVRFRNEIKW